MKRALVLLLSVAGLLSAALFAARSGPSEVPTIEQLLERRDLEEIARLRALFGETDAVLVALRRPGGVPPERLRRVEEALRGVEGVRGTCSRASRPRLLPDGPPAPPSSLLEPDASSSLVVVALEPDALKLSRARSLVAAIDDALARVAESGETVLVLGAPQVRVASWDIVAHDLRRLLPLLALVVAAVPILFFASPGAALFPLVLAALTTAITLALYRLFDGPLNALVMLLVPIVWSVSTLDAMHVYTCVRRRGAGSQATLLLPCLVNTLTAMGALGALAVQSEPRLLASFGLWGTVGTCIAYVLTFTLGGAMLGLGRRRPPPRWPGRFAAAAVRLSERRRRPVLAVWAALLLAAAAFTARLGVEVRYPDFFAEGQPLEREVRAMRGMLGTDLMPLEIRLEAKDDHGRLPAALANAMLAVAHYLHTLPETRFVLPLDLLDAGALDARDRRPGALDRALEDLAGDPQVVPWIRFDLGAARLEAHFAGPAFARREEIRAWLEHFGSTMLSHHRLSLGGPAFYYPLAERRGVRGALLGGALSLLVIAGALLWAFRGARVFLAALLGNVAPLLLVTGLMGALGLSWSLAMLPLPAVLLGLAVDDTFHLLWPLRGRRRPGRLSLARSALRTGPPVLATTAVLIGCVSTLALSGLVLNRELGLLLAAGLLFALACDLSLVPALLAAPEAPTSSGRRSAAPPP